MGRSALLVAALTLFLAGCSGAQAPSATNLCPTPSSFCEGNTLVQCRTSRGTIPEPTYTRTDCGSRVCVPEPTGARCR